MADALKAIGLMSGTSLDGIDAALVETDGERIVVSGPALSVPYDSAQRALLKSALAEAARAPVGAPMPEAVRSAEAMLTEAHREIIAALVGASGLSPGEIDIVGFHGQTILHRPQERRTWQIGDGAKLAAALGIDVVTDFRVADVAAGGEGAPFVPLYHAALAGALGETGPVAVLNVGGVANVTYVGTDTTVLAFDTGPGNAPIDDWAQRHTGEPVDRDGALARSGAVREDVLIAMLDHPYFTRPPPKSLDRMDFTFDAVAHLSPADGAATLTAFTAAAIARAIAHLPARPSRWIVCGGGRRNPQMMRELAKRLNAPVSSAEDAGWRGDFIEAEAFGYLAVRSLRGLPLSLPSTTGVPHPMPGGKLHRHGAG